MSTAALATAIRIFTEVEAFAMKEAGKVEARAARDADDGSRGDGAGVWGPGGLGARQGGGCAGEDLRAQEATGSQVRGADERATQDADAGGVCEARGQDAVFAQAGRSVQVARRGRAEIRLKSEERRRRGERNLIRFLCFQGFR